MREDLGLYGNQLNYIQTCWTVGYVLGEIPSNLILTRVRPSIWIPACEVTWATLTILLAKCDKATHVYVLRFFIGLAESTFYPGMQYIIGSWYRKDELAKRSCIFHTSSAIGTMFSGYLMAAVYHLDGVNGFHGWQWLFIVNGIISLPIAVGGFFFLPDYPHNTRAFYLNDRDKEIAAERMALEGRGAMVGQKSFKTLFTPARLKKLFSSWHIYALTLLYVLFNNGNGIQSQPAFQLWLKKDLHMSITKVNVYPTITSVVQVITTLLYAWSSDSLFRGARWPPMIISGVILIIAHTSLAIWDIAQGWHWACYFLVGAGGGISGLCFAWAHEICKDDVEERALVTGSMNEMAYVLQAWLPLIVWQTVDAPKYRTGTITMIGLNVGLIATALTVRYLHKRELRQKQGVVDSDEEATPIDGTLIKLSGTANDAGI